MNIFATSHSPKESAIALDDRRLIKMILETAQILSTATKYVGCYDESGLYKSTHENHPCTLWAKQSLANFVWLVEHGFALSGEYEFRFGKQHKSFAVIQKCLHHVKIGNFKFVERTDFVNCTDFDLGDTVLSYRAALNAKWQKDGKAARWTKREQPSWKV